MRKNRHPLIFSFPILSFLVWRKSIKRLAKDNSVRFSNNSCKKNRATRRRLHFSARQSSPASPPLHARKAMAGCRPASALQGAADGGTSLAQAAPGPARASCARMSPPSCITANTQPVNTAKTTALGTAIRHHPINNILHGNIKQIPFKINT